LVAVARAEVEETRKGGSIRVRALLNSLSLAKPTGEELSDEVKRETEESAGTGANALHPGTKDGSAGTEARDSNVERVGGEAGVSRVGGVVAVELVLDRSVVSGPG